VNTSHFLTIVWLRWRLMVNQWTRGGALNGVILATLIFISIPTILAMFVGAFLGGAFSPPEELTPDFLMYMWDGIILYFLMFWIVGMLLELKRSETLSISKFLHLPVSLTSVFVLNYLSSFFCFSMAVFLPMTLGFVFGLIVSRGAAMLLLLASLLAFFLMVTALTYQFQGWLAALMVNKRLRRNVIVVATFVAILVFQLPNLINIYQPWNKKANATKEEQEQNVQQLKDTAWLVNVLLPPGWLPLCAKAAAENDWLVGGLTFLGMTLLGVASLWRGYHTTLRLHTGAFTAGAKAPQTPARPLAVSRGERETASGGLLEKKLPGLSEQAAVIALAGFRSLLRAPESKLVILTPIFLLFGFAMLMQNVHEISEAYRPLLAFGAMGMSIFSLDQFLSNQFGFDRQGFRIFVLCPAPRKDILLGKNLAVAPLAVMLAIIPVIPLQIFYPLPLDKFFALLPQFVSMYVLFCILANFLSIYVPLHIPAGSFKPTNFNIVTVLLRLVFVFLIPVFMSPTLLPFAIDYYLTKEDMLSGVSVALVLALVECALLVWLYRLVLIWQGRLLQGREQKILDIVTTKSE
jgi:ABC-2 type transport system permease protein